MISFDVFLAYYEENREVKIIFFDGHCRSINDDFHELCGINVYETRNGLVQIIFFDVHCKSINDVFHALCGINVYKTGNRLYSLLGVVKYENAIQLHGHPKH